MQKGQLDGEINKKNHLSWIKKSPTSHQNIE